MMAWSPRWPPDEGVLLTGSMMALVPRTVSHPPYRAARWRSSPAAVAASLPAVRVRCAFACICTGGEPWEA